jgi:putative ABC transport system ATP-binding protein
MNAFDFDHVSLVAGEARILDDVTTAIAADGITVVIGPSGAGKSTLLRLCNRLEVPTNGVVRYRGDDIDQLDPLQLRRHVGMVFQRPTLFPGSVKDNLQVACPHGDDELFLRALAAAALAPTFLDRSGDELSGGEAQRACLARTLVTEPTVLLMDEPTSSLDGDNVTALEGSVRALAHAGTTVLWVTHDLQQANRLADHTIKLEAGRVVG